MRGYKRSVTAQTADDALWSRMRAGDVEAWGVLFERHSALVYRFCVRFLGSADEAEDVLSDVFLEAWRARSSFVVHEGGVLPILLAVARRCCQKRRRSNQRLRQVHRVASEAATRIAGPEDQSTGDDDESRRKQWLRDEVGRLPVPFRDVFELAIYAEMPYDRVSMVLGIPVGTVKSRMSRARHLLEVSAGLVRCDSDAHALQAR